MQRAAMTASALAKERRELKEQQQRTLLEAIPKDLSRYVPHVHFCTVWSVSVLLLKSMILLMCSTVVKDCYHHLDCYHQSGSRCYDCYLRREFLEVVPDCNLSTGAVRT